MRCSAVLSAVLVSVPLVLGESAWFAPDAGAQPAPKPAASAAVSSALYRDEALVFEQFDTTVRMHADGTGERLVHVKLRIQSEGAARQFGVLSVSYASAYETGAMDYVRVHKADGTTVETPVADAIELPAPVTREAPLYSDLKEKQLPVRSLTPGDVLEYQLHTVRSKAEAPGQFWGAEHFTVAGMVVLHETLTLETPAATSVTVWSPTHPSTPTVHDGVRTWRWESSQLKPAVRDKDGKMTAAETHDPDQDADGRMLPSVGWTTFRSWAEVGAWYGGLAAGRAQPTDAVRAKADELTRDAKTPEQQVRALYQFVSARVRYVGIDLGIGRYQPHPAAEVLATQYGDCKDKDTLLEALLRAKGFQTAPALIGVNIAPVAELPSPAVFNHVITTVQMPGGGGRLWLDATPEVEPFQALMAPIRDQQALVIPTDGVAALIRTPKDPPFPFFEHFDAVAILDKTGLLKSRMSFTVRSDSEPGFRTLAERAAPAQWDDVMQYVSGAMGFGGKVTHADLHPTDISQPMHLTYDYSRPDFADWSNLRIVPLFPALEVTVIGKDTAPEHDIDQGTPRTLEAHTEITLPEGYRADLPESLHVVRRYATFNQTYRLDGAKLTVDRTVVILEKKVPKSEWKDYLAYTKAIGMESGENFITLLAPAAKVTVTTTQASTHPLGKVASEKSSVPADSPRTSFPEAGASGEATAEQLVDTARKAETTGDWDGARTALVAARARDPKAPYLMSMTGYLALRDRKPEEAIADFHAELKEHPDADSSIVLLLSGTLVREKRETEATSLLQSYSDRNDSRISQALAEVQGRLGRHGVAVATLEKASAAHGDDRGLASQLAGELRLDHREVEAAAAAKAAMDGSTDPAVLNTNSFLLSEMNVDLPLAESCARQAITTLENASAERSLAEVNSHAFAEATLLTATWDTLGWILFEEGRPKEAEPYLAAAWFNSPGITIGRHLGRVREALGRPSEALEVDQLALATERASDSTEDFAQANGDVARLRKGGVHASVGDSAQALQAMRSFRVNRPSGLKGWGTFRVQLGEAGVHEAAQVGGPGELRPIVPELKTLHLPGAVPHGSRAYLLRDAVVSCSSFGPDCEVVLMPHAGLGAEAVE